MRELEQLCRPLVRSLCEYWYYACRGVSPDMEVVNHSLREHLIRIREQVEDDGRLKREFQKIEQPLVFFIDYTVKEGHFPFRDQWTEIARDYNELSGDEKFFDLLSDSLDDPDSSEQLMMFYLFMGLGFDGCHVDDREYVQRRMKVCAARIQLPATADETLSSADIEERPAYFKNRRFRFFSVYTLLTILTLYLLGSLGWNFWTLYQETGDFRLALGKAANAAGKMSLSSSEKTAQKPQAQPTQQPVQPPEIKPMPQPTQQMDAQQLKQQMEASLMPQQDAGAAQPSSDVQMTQPPDAQTTQQPESLAQQLEALLEQQQKAQAEQLQKAQAAQQPDVQAEKKPDAQAQQPDAQTAQQPDAKQQSKEGN